MEFGCKEPEDNPGPPGVVIAGYEKNPPDLSATEFPRDFSHLRNRRFCPVSEAFQLGLGVSAGDEKLDSDFAFGAVEVGWAADENDGRITLFGEVCALDDSRTEEISAENYHRIRWLGPLCEDQSFPKPDADLVLVKSSPRSCC